MRTTILLCCALLSARGATGQSTHSDQDATAACFAKFTAALGDDRSDPRAFLQLVREQIWDTYEWPAERKREVFDYLRKAKDGPGKGFAAFVAVGYRDPEGVFALLDAAGNPDCFAGTRYYCLNAAPCVLGMGDVWNRGDKTPEDDARYVENLREFAGLAKLTSIGRAHTSTVEKVLAQIAEAEEDERSGDLGLALWHVSAYQLGTLDLGCGETLIPLLDKPGSTASNVLFALMLSANRDFRTEQGEPPKSREEADTMRRAAAGAAKEWWLTHKEEADRPLRERLLESFEDRGIDPKEPMSARSLEALRALLDVEEIWSKYNAYRLVNELTGSHYDLDFVFLLDKYALHPIVSGLDAESQEERLRERVTQRLGRLIAEAKK